MNSKIVNRSISLKLPSQTQFLPIAQDCVEKASELFGLTGVKLMKLGLAVEEIFLHLARLTDGEKEISLHIIPGSISVDIQFELQSDSLNLSAMNIVSADDVQTMLEQEDFNQIGLLLAASFIDKFYLKHLSESRYSLLLSQEKEYPQLTSGTFDSFSAKPPFVLDESPTANTLQQACIQALALYPEQAYSTTFQQPGRFSDLVQGGDLAALVLKDSVGSICGLIIWEKGEEKSVTFYGPYIFTDTHREKAAAQIVEGFIGFVARSRAIITFTSQATNMLPMAQFESLGELRYCPPKGNCLTLQSCYRHLREDHGETVWAHPALIPFLEEHYERLVLIRHIQATGEHGETRADASVFGVELDSLQSLAIIKPMLNGQDISQNISLHVASLRKQKIHNIICILDLAIGWQGAMAGPLMEQGFTAQFVQPLAGRGDCVIFQYATTTP